jgi:hypothetical protein
MKRRDENVSVTMCVITANGSEKEDFVPLPDDRSTVNYQHFNQGQTKVNISQMCQFVPLFILELRSFILINQKEAIGNVTEILQKGF